MVTVTIFDETVSGQKSEGFDLEFETATISARELIRKRVYEEVREFNLKEPGHFSGLVQPGDTEAVLNGYKLRKPRKIDWEEQYNRAVEAFERNGFFILVDDRQVESLDEKIEIKLRTQVSFVKLDACSNARHNFEICRNTVARAIEIDDVQTRRALIHPPLRHRNRIGTVNCFFAVVALQQPHTLAATNINGWNNFHDVVLNRRECRKSGNLLRSAYSALFFLSASSAVNL